MIPYKTFPIEAVGPIHINLYGIMFVAGFLCATYLAIQDAKKRNIEKDIIYDLAFYALIGGVVGARLFYVFFYWPADVPLTFFDIFKIWHGGLAFFGGFIGAIISGYLYIRKKKLDFWVYADIFAIPLVVGHIMGRVGDYLTGGHPGKETSVPWGIYMEGELRHPVVLYEILGLAIIVIVLLILRRKGLFNGFLFLSYVMLYAVQRLLLDFFRIEETDPRYLGLTPSQFVVIIFLLLASYSMVVRFRTIRFKQKQ